MAPLMTRTPPALAVRLLRWCVSAAAFETVAGDLDEEFGRGRSTAWYWLQTLKSIAAFWTGRLPAAVDVLAASFRQLRRQKLYVAGAAGTLALAVATALASAVVVKRAFIDALPYPHADRLEILTTDGFPSLSVHVYREMLERPSPYDAFAAIRGATLTLSTNESTTTVTGSQVTREYFEIAGIRPAHGEFWQSPSESAVVVSWAFFQRELHADPAAVGRPIIFDGTPRTVVAVLPATFMPPYWPQHEVWVPLDLTTLEKEPRGRRQLTIVARRAEGRSPEEVAAYFAAMSKRLQTDFPVEHGRQTWFGRPLREEMLETSQAALIGLAAGATLLLFIVCANVGGLAAARAVGMRQQMAVRQALGGSRGRIFAEQLADAVLIAAAGTAAGLLLAPVLVAIAASYQLEFLNRFVAIELDTTLTALGVLAGMAIGTLAALAPARMIARASLPAVIRTARGVTGGRGLTIARQALVVAQVALALMLVVGAGLLVRTVRYLSDRPLGFTTEGMTTMNVTLPGKRFATQAAQVQFEEDLLARLRTLPGVADVTASVGLPASRAMGASLHIRGRSVDTGLPEVGYNSVAPGFMRMMGIPIEAGRDITELDRAGMTGAILVNTTMARQYWPDGDAIGALIFLGPGAANPGQWMQVVGIVPDVRPYAPAERVTPTAYGSTRQYSWPRRFFTVRTREVGVQGAPTVKVAAPPRADDLRAAVRATDPTVSVGFVRELTEIAEAQRGRHRLVMSTLLVFAGVALVLCASGLYAVAAMMSRLRRREYAIRLALGARREDVRWRVVRQSIALAGAGIVAGLALAAGAVQLIEGLVHGVASLDPATFITAALGLALVAAGAAWWPAQAAARVDPVETLKAD
jgi:putative ABC transport system permease protein